MRRNQAPAFYRTMLGKFEVTVLCDSSPERQLDSIASKQDQVRNDLHNDYHTLNSPLSVNGFLINTGSKLVLVDSGAGEGLGRELLSAGYRPSQVDAVLLTHFHPDHVGGLTVGGKRCFPHATVYADRKEGAYWLDPAATPEVLKKSKAAKNALAPYIKAGRLSWIDSGASPVPGIVAVRGYGHTPGHTLYKVESQGNTLLLWGDLVHLTPSQFLDPDVTVSYDADPVQARAARRKWMEEASREGYLVGGDHLSFPGLGHVGKTASGYRWIPIFYRKQP